MILLLFLIIILFIYLRFIGSDNKIEYDDKSSEGFYKSPEYFDMMNKGDLNPDTEEQYKRMYRERLKREQE